VAKERSTCKMMGGAASFKHSQGDKERDTERQKIKKKKNFADQGQVVPGVVKKGREGGRGGGEKRGMKKNRSTSPTGTQIPKGRRVRGESVTCIRRERSLGSSPSRMPPPLPVPA